MKAFLAQARAETVMTLRRGESLLLAVIIPVAALAGFSSFHILNIGHGPAVDFLTPGILALAIMSTAMVNLSIATGFERYYGVLKRLGTTPLGRPRLVAAKTVSVLAVEVIQVVVLVAVALALGWHPGVSPATGHSGAVVSLRCVVLAVAAGLVATVAFAALGMLIAGLFSAYVILGLSNALWFVLLLVSGMFAPLSSLPSGLRHLSQALPSTALSELFHRQLQAGAAYGAMPWLVLGAWAIGAGAAAVATFRWE